MKQNIKKSLFALVLLIIFSFNVKAAEALAPQTIPTTGTQFYAKLDDEFDYSKISFTTSPSGGTNIVGKAEMQKIWLGSGYTGTSLSNDMFTVYCLNELKKYPIGYVNKNFAATVTNNFKFDRALESALLNHLNMNTNNAMKALFENVNRYGTITITYETLTNEQISDFLNNGTTVTVLINSIAYDTDRVVITGSQLNAAAGNAASETYSYSFKLTDAMYDIYTTDEMPNTTYYNRALWIIEHSYPTLPIATTLEDAGTTYASLLLDIKSLHSGETHSDEEWNTLAEEYVYSTIQYALWKAEDGLNEIQGTTTYKLGDRLVGSTALNKLYQYLIKDRDIYTNYSSFEFNNTITLNKPIEGEELNKETDSIYKYGPYSVSSGMLSMGNATIKIDNKDKTGIKVVDSAGNEISSVRQEEEFYITTSKNAKIASVSITIGVTNGLIFNPSTNRGRIYSPNYILEQDVISGGLRAPATGSQQFDLVYNPKTGVESLATVLLITLIAFSMGYFVLRFKNKPIEI